MPRAAAPALALAALSLIALAGAALAQQTRLVMFEQPGCPWCARWEAEVGDAYAKTAEGRRAPLLRAPLSGPLPEAIEDVEIRPRPRVTPVFVLVHDGAEIGRITGYPGEDFFWPMLDRLLDRLPPPEPEPES